MHDKNSSLTERAGALSGAIFLFGLAALVLVDLVWPGILVLIWLTSIPVLLAEQGWMGLWVIAQAALWLFGLPFLIAAGLIWPGVLVLAGMSALLVAVAPPDRLQSRSTEPRKAKRKRALPLPDDHEWLGEDDVQSEDAWPKPDSKHMENHHR